MIIMLARFEMLEYYIVSTVIFYLKQTRPVADRNPVHTSLRNYIRHQRSRDITDNLQSLLDADAASRGSNSDGTTTADPLISSARAHRYEACNDECEPEMVFLL